MVSSRFSLAYSSDKFGRVDKSIVMRKLLLTSKYARFIRLVRCRLLSWFLHKTSLDKLVQLDNSRIYKRLPYMDSTAIPGGNHYLRTYFIKFSAKSTVLMFPYSLSHWGTADSSAPFASTCFRLSTSRCFYLVYLRESPSASF